MLFFEEKKSIDLTKVNKVMIWFKGIVVINLIFTMLVYHFVLAKSGFVIDVFDANQNILLTQLSHIKKCKKH